jgi:hypothetical protein
LLVSCHKKPHLCTLELRWTTIIPNYVFKGECEAFLHTVNMKICTHKTCLEMELLCSCSLTSKVVQCNAMKFIKNLMCCVHLEDTRHCGRIITHHDGMWRGIMLMFIQCHAWSLNPSCSIHHTFTYNLLI